MTFFIDSQEQSWVDRAACRGMDPAVFFPSTEEETDLALDICRSCPVRAECLEYALASKERFGIWGGATERERRRMLRRTA